MKIKNAEKLISALNGQYPKARLHVDGKLFQNALKDFPHVQIKQCNLTVHGKVNLPNTSINVRGGRFDAPRLTVNNVDTPFSGFACVGNAIGDAINAWRSILIVRGNVGGDAINHGSRYMSIGGNVGGDAINELTPFDRVNIPKHKLGTLNIYGKADKVVSGRHGGKTSVKEAGTVYYSAPGTLHITGQKDKMFIWAWDNGPFYINGVKIPQGKGSVKDIKAFLKTVPQRI